MNQQHLASPATALSLPLPSRWALEIVRGRLPASRIELVLTSDFRFFVSDESEGYHGIMHVESQRVTFLLPPQAARPTRDGTDDAAAFRGALERAASFGLDGDRLKFADARDKVLVILSARPTILAGSSWNVVRYIDFGRFIVAQGVTLSFGLDGWFTVTSDEKRAFGSYAIDGAVLMMWLLGTSGSNGPTYGRLRGRDQAFAAAVSRVNTYWTDGSRLRLLTVEGQVAIECVRADDMAGDRPDPPQRRRRHPHART